MREFLAFLIILVMILAVAFLVWSVQDAHLRRSLEERQKAAAQATLWEVIPLEFHVDWFQKNPNVDPSRLKS